jgi:CRISPR system Cascade subunit CasE
VPESLHLVKIPLRPEKLMTIARSRALPLRDLDDGYLCHCVMRELWQERAPTPFVIRGSGRTLDVWGYSESDAEALVEHARAFGDPLLLAAITDLDAVASKGMPRFKAGRRLGFLLRACPVVRLAQATNGHMAGAEIDAFLAQCFAAGKDVAVSREQVYREWIAARVNRPITTGATLDGVRVAAISRERLVRRTQGNERKAMRLERPDVRFEGEVVVVDGGRFHEWLAHGVGRHRAFGFGALMLVPPGTVHAV